MDAGTDPNNRLTGRQFALFPLKRLAWGTRYTARADVVMDGKPRTLRWSFVTRELPGRVVTCGKGGGRFRTDSGQRINLYLPPASRAQAGIRWRASNPGGTRLEVRSVDMNTLAVTFRGAPGQQAKVKATLEGPDPVTRTCVVGLR